MANLKNKCLILTAETLSGASAGNGLPALMMADQKGCVNHDKSLTFRQFCELAKLAEWEKKFKEGSKR